MNIAAVGIVKVKWCQGASPWVTLVLRCVCIQEMTFNNFLHNAKRISANKMVMCNVVIYCNMYICLPTTFSRQKKLLTNKKV